MTEIHDSIFTPEMISVNNYRIMLWRRMVWKHHGKVCGVCGIKDLRFRRKLLKMILRLMLICIQLKSSFFLLYYIRGAIKKFSAWPSSLHNKILFASYSSKAQNTTCTMWLLGYKYFVCISAYEQSVCQMVLRMLTPELYTSFWRTSQTIPMWPGKNLFHNSLFRMKCGSTTSILSQNDRACNGTNESVKIVISLHCVTPFFPCCMRTTDDG